MLERALGHFGAEVLGDLRGPVRGERVDDDNPLNEGSDAGDAALDVNLFVQRENDHGDG
jgi:hypothetical protein